MDPCFSQGRTLLLVNPVAQHGNGSAAAESAERLLRASLADRLDVRFTEYAGHARQIAIEACGAYSSLVMLGGDGTVHEVANGLMSQPAGKRPLLGLLPLGSGNDYARTLGLSFKLEQAVAQLFMAQPHAMDLGSCNNEYFVETLSFGLDAAVALGTIELRERTGRTGTMLYLQSGIDQLLHHLDVYHTEAWLEGHVPFRRAVYMLAVQVGPTYGGGFRVCPKAKPDDGLLDVCYTEAPLSMPKASFMFMLAKEAHHAKFKQVHFAQVRSLNLAFDVRPPVQMDGEAHIADTYDITVHKQVLKVLVPSL